MNPAPPRPSLHVRRDRCIGAGLCVLTAPEVFDQADDGLVVLLSPQPPEQADEAIREAVRRCPSGALSLRPQALNLQPPTAPP